MTKGFYLAGSLLLLTTMAATEGSKNPVALSSVWGVAVPAFTTSSSSSNMVKAILTPTQSIVVTRIEAFSERGPMAPTGSGNPKPCLAQFALQISNCTTTHVVAISNEFRKPSSAETYTDSGKLSLLFAADTPVGLSLIAPEPGFPPVQCTCNGLNVAIQYRAADATK